MMRKRPLRPHGNSRSHLPKKGIFHRLVANSVCEVVALLVGMFLWQATPVTAQTNPATLPNITVAMGGEVIAIAVQNDGKVVLGGDFTSVNGVACTNLARVNPNGSLDVTWIPNPDGVVSNLILNGSEIYVAGAFTRIGGLFRTNLAKLSSLDSGAADSVWAPQPNGPVYCVALSDTNLYVGGGFTRIGGGTAAGAAAVSTQGSGLATGWSVTATGGQIAAIVAAAGNVFVGGSFTAVNGTARRGLAKLGTATGAPLNAFWNPSPDKPVDALAQAGGLLIVGGAFSSIGSPVISQPNLARLNVGGTGAADTNWRPQFSISASGCTNARIYSLTADDTYVYVTGQFDNVGGLPRQGVVRVDMVEGEPDPGWTPLFRTFNRLCFFDTCWYPECSSFDGDFVRVRTLVRTQTGIYAGGRFGQVSGQAALGIARLDATVGTPDVAFPVQTGRQKEDRNTGLGQIFTIATQDDGKLLVGGRFELINGRPRLNLARLNSDGTLDEFWQPNPNDRVLALATRGSEIFVGGDFTFIGGTNRANLVKFSTVGADSIDADWAPAPNSRVSSLAVRGTNLCAVGDFTEIGSPPVMRSGVAFISPDGTGQVYPQVPQALVGFGGYSLYGWFGNVVLDDTYAYLHGTLVEFHGTNGYFYNLGRLRLSTGQADSSWRPMPGSSGFENFAEALVVSGTNIFVGGYFGLPTGQTNLARIDYVTGAAMPWGPRPSGITVAMAPRFIQPCSAMALCGSNLYIAGTFTNLNGGGISHLARLDAFGSGSLDTTWRPQPDNDVHRLAARSNDVFAAGFFSVVGAAARAKVAFLPTADPPSLFKVSATNFLILRNPGDGAEVTHFRITGVTGGTVYLNDGITPVNVGDFVTAAQGEAGLIFIGAANGTVTAVSSLNGTPGGAGKVAATLDFSAPQPPVVSFASATYSVSEKDNNVRVTVKKTGIGVTTVQYYTADGTALAYDPNLDSGDYLTANGTLSFPVGETNKSFIISIIDNEVFTGDRVFWIALTNVTGGGRLAFPARAAVTIAEDDNFGLSGSFTTARLPNPVAPSVLTGSLQVFLGPSAANGQWRLAGEIFWRNSGTVVSGLPTDNYVVEFRSVTNYYELLSDTVPVVAGQTTQRTYQYAAKSALESGEVTVLIHPDSVATNADVNLRGQWRLLGEIDWHDSGKTISGVNAGGQILEFKAVPNFSKHLNLEISVFGGINNQVEVSYLVQPASGAPGPRPLSFAEVTDTSTPYVYCGQLQTDVGLSSGIVVKERVVLTVAHALFRDATLEWVSGARWFFQQHAGDYQPVPQYPRGWYVFTGYATQRSNDLKSGSSPGYSTPESQQLDAAALYFIETDYSANQPGRGGFSGYLSSDAGALNEHLLSSRNKLLAGYPLIPGAETNWGKMHTTPPTNLFFSPLNSKVFATMGTISFPGNSGGPLCVQWTNGVYYPAAIYLGGTAETRVRAIDGEIADLINRAENSGNGGGNSTGGGVTTVSPGLTAPPFGAGLLTVLLPDAPSFARLGWRIIENTDTNFVLSQTGTVALVGGGGYQLEFKRVPGFIAPSNRTVQVAINQTAIISANYAPIHPLLSLNRTSGLSIGGPTGGNYRVEFATNLIRTATWTPLTTLNLSNPSIRISNTVPVSSGRRYYRAVLVP